MTRSASSEAFLAALGAAGPAAERDGNMDLYGWLIGSWELDVARYGDDGSIWRRPGEWHFGWVLEGRAIQDVWIVPLRGAGRQQGAAADNAHSYGTTLRTYDPKRDAWHIQWTDPVTQAFFTMTGRREGRDIVQLGTIAGGHRLRWSFREIEADAFLWRGEISADGGATWRTNVEFRARRKPGHDSATA